MVNVRTVYRDFLETRWKNICYRESRQGFFQEFKKMTLSPKTTGNRRKKIDEITYYLLKISSAEYPEYWLYVDLSEDLTLLNLDSFLRETWLECCGHLSSFIVMEETYESHTDKLTDRDSKSMRIKLKELLQRKRTNQNY